MAGGKIAKLDRVIIENMADEQTAVAALKAGEIDFYEIPPIDLLDQLESDKNIKLDVLNKGGNVGMCRLNWLHPPFDKVEARQAMLHLIKQEDILKAVFGNPKYYRSCGVAVCLHRPDAERGQHRLVQGWPEHRQGQRSCSRRPATTAARSSSCRRPISPS